MKISVNWLEEWIDLSGIETDELTHRLTMAGLEVDAVEEIGAGHDEIVVGRIDRIDEHPEADKLVLCQVDVGDGTDRQIACGATNMKEGDLVPVALPGSQPPAVDFEIAAREMMGEASEGMLCSAEELGLEEESPGLMILPEDLPLGEPFFEAVGIRDTVIEFDLTPNRADCLSHLGVARDIAAIWERELEEPEPSGEAPIWEVVETARQAADVADLTVRDPEGCPRYAFGIVEDIEVGPSPLWLKSRLAAVGVRPVNNIVDVTNYVLMDVGQPLHAFDLDELEGPEIIVRRAEEGETLEGIDHETYELSTEDLVIADAERPVALAGVMGGAETEVGESTERILLECAFFDPRTVRRSAKRHGLHTESSHRFERRIDPAGTERYLDRALRLYREGQGHLEGADAPTILSGMRLESAEGAADGWRVELDEDLPGRILGGAIDEETVVEMLERLDLQLSDIDGGWEAEIPTWRGDLTRGIDLVEEVARLYGYDKFPEEYPERGMGGDATVREEADHPPTIVGRRDRSIERRVRQRLLDAGLYEVVNPSFISAESLDELRLPDDDVRRQLAEVANPLRASDRYMRTTLMAGLLENLKANRAQKRQNVAIFEKGRCYFPERERETVGILLAGRAREHWTERRDWDFYDLKGLVELTGMAFDEEGAEWRAPDEPRPWLHPGIQAGWRVDGDVIAEAGRLHPEIVQELELEGPILLAEVDYEALAGRPERDRRFEAYSDYPPVDRDVALVVDSEVGFSEIEGAIGAYRREDEAFDELAESVELFDVYEGEQVEAGRRSLAFSVRYRADDRTLTEEEVAPLDEGLVEWLGESIGADRR